MNKPYNISSFLQYIGINTANTGAIQVINYDQHQNIRLQSEPVQLDFYLIAIKNNIEVDPPVEGMSSSYLFLDKPGNIMEWDLANPFSGYGIFIDTSLVYKFVKDYSFTGYDHHEALFLTDRESKLLDDLFSKAYEEYHRNTFSQDVLVSYAMLILAYTRTFYERQFESRSTIYNKVVADFHRQLDQYFGTGNNSSQFPTVAHFAGKANLSVNYFGDLIKHFTGQSPIEHIHQHIIQIAKKELLETKLSINEIAYGLGFEYPTYFTRFFRQKTGLSPTAFRKQ